jgi:hypothetical protein
VRGIPAPAGQAPLGQRLSLCSAAEGQQVLFAGADLVPMLGVSLAVPDAVLHGSLNVVGGRAGGIRGVQIGSVFNLVSGGACGVQIAGAVNVARGAVGLQIGGAMNAVESARGAQIAGAVNISRDVAGMQIAGAANIVEDASGVQIAGAVNAARSAAGVQIAGGLNLAGGFRGVQIAGGLNLGGDTGGLQIAGGFNMASAIRGLQIAGGFNMASAIRGLQLAPVDLAGRVDGAQVGVINVAGRVRGVQLGVLNVADESDVSVGVVSFVRRGRYHLDVWGAETGLLMAAFKHGGRYFHNFYGVGVRPFGDQARVAFSLGIGGHIPASRRFFVDVDALGYSLHRTDAMSTRPVFLAQVRAMVGARLSGSFAVAAGPSYNVGFAGSREDAALSALGGSVLGESPGLSVQGWPGVSIGIQSF